MTASPRPVDAADVGAARGGRLTPDERRAAGIYVAVLVLSTVLFATLSTAVLLIERIERLDVRFGNWVHTAVPEWLVESMRILTYAGSVVLLGPLTVLAVLFLARRRRPDAALFVGAAFAGSQLVTQVLKLSFGRPRPELEEPFVEVATYAFPSGHASGATATYGAIALVLASEASSRAVRAALLASGVALIVLIAASRVILGVHYLFDVVAGIIAGVAWLGVLLLVLQLARGGLRLVLFPKLGGDEQP